MTDELTEMDIEMREVISGWVKAVDTNQGSWENELITTVRAFQDFELNPVGSSILLCWVASTIEQYLIDNNEHDEVMIPADHLYNYGDKLLGMVLDALVSHHNKRLLEEDELCN